jgi:hypothetical protein
MKSHVESLEITPFTIDKQRRRQRSGDATGDGTNVSFLYRSRGDGPSHGESKRFFVDLQLPLRVWILLTQTLWRQQLKFRLFGTDATAMRNGFQGSWNIGTVATSLASDEYFFESRFSTINRVRFKETGA